MSFVDEFMTSINCSMCSSKYPALYAFCHKHNSSCENALERFIKYGPNDKGCSHPQNKLARIKGPESDICDDVATITTCYMCTECGEEFKEIQSCKCTYWETTYEKIDHESYE